MYIFTTQIRVRYAETDQMGYVYYGNYAMYYEVARTESLRHLGITYKELEHDGIMMPVLETSSKYLKPARYDDLLTIKVSIPSFPGVKIFFLYEIYNEVRELINTGNTTLAFVNIASAKPVRMPEKMKQVLNSYYNER
jgi:acyl-CoA thioester hydrolase